MHKAAERAGIGKRALRRAKDRLEVKSKREGFGPDGVWKWAIQPPTEGTYGGPSMVERETASISSVTSIDAHSQNGGIYGDRSAPMDEAEDDRLLEIGRQLGLVDDAS